MLRLHHGSFFYRNEYENVQGKFIVVPSPALHNNEVRNINIVYC